MSPPVFRTMEVLFSSVFFGILVLLLYRLGAAVVRYYNVCRKLCHVPQKQAHWLWGHILEVKDSMAYMTYATDVMKQGNKLYCIWTGPFPNVGVCHPETFNQLIKQVNEKARGLADPYRYIESWIGDGLLVSAGKKWERNRRLLTPAFHFDILSGYVTVMNEVTQQFLDKLSEASKDGQSVDISPYVCAATLDSMLKCSLSYDGSMQEDDEHEYIVAVKRLSTMIWQRMVKPWLAWDTIFRLTSLGREQQHQLGVAHSFTGGLIKARRKALKEQPDLKEHKRRLDFLDILLTARDEHGQGLSDSEIQDEVDTFTFEGHDTTASAISFAIYALGQYPDVQKKVYEDVESVLGEESYVRQEDLSKFTYLPCFIKEVMRFYSTVPLICRQHTQPIVLDGIEIPPGPRVDINLYAIHRNPQVWTKPEEFDPDRFHADKRDETEIFGFVPFSAGIRNCIGQVFAMNEMKITLALLVKRFEVLPDKEHSASLLPEVVMRSSNGIPVFFKDRSL